MGTMMTASGRAPDVGVCSGRPWGACLDPVLCRHLRPCPAPHHAAAACFSGLRFRRNYTQAWWLLELWLATGC